MRIWFFKFFSQFLNHYFTFSPNEKIEGDFMRLLTLENFEKKVTEGYNQFP